jgi:hypothetical protein
MATGDSDFTKDELDLLEAARQEQEEADKNGPRDETTEATGQQAADKASEQATTTTDGTATTTTTADNATTTTTEAAPAPAAQAPAQPAERPQGDLRNALRAARRSEKRANDELARLRQENEDLKAGKKPADAPAISDEELNALEQDFPQVAGVVKALKTQVDVLKTTAKPAPAPAPEFLPEVLPDELQEVVDENPDLLAWQLNPDQTNFALAKQADRLLMNSPKWADKPYAERFAEVVRLVKEQTGQAPAPSKTTTTTAPAPAPAAKTVEDAKKVIEQAATATPVGIGDLRGSSTPAKTEPDFRRMTDDQILASLPH